MERVMQVTKHFGVRTGVLINKCDLNQEMVERIIVLSRKYGAEIMGELPYDNEFTEAQMKALTLVEYTENDTVRTLKEIWGKVASTISS